jgi:hypothetical protein
VLANFRKHAPDHAGVLDLYSSAPHFTGFRELEGRAPLEIRPNLFPRALAPPARAPAPVNPPETWLLARDWKRHGLIALREAPKGEARD